LLDSPGPPTQGDLELLRACLGDARKRVQRRAAEVCAALARGGWPIADLLDHALAAPALRLRWGAAYALSLLGPVPAAAQSTLLELLGDSDGDLRWAAAELLKRLAASRRLQVVAQLIASVRDVPSRRKMALYCLRDLGAVEAVAVAADALADEQIQTRLAALAYLAALDPDRDRLARRIAALIDDADPAMRRAAAGTLGSVGVRLPEVMAALERAIASTDVSLRRAAQRSLNLLVSA
jgi:HEAT repeat protein